MLKNMQINTRLILSFMVVVAFLVITGVVSIVMLSRVGAALEDFYDTSYQTVVNAHKGKRELAYIRANLASACLEQDINKMNQYISESRKALDDFQTICNNLEKTYMGDKSNIDRLNSLVSQAQPVVERLFTYATTVDAVTGEYDVQKAYACLNDEYQPIADQAIAIFDTVGNEADVLALANNMRHMTKTITLLKT